jgi:hypothetical protein
MEERSPSLIGVQEPYASSRDRLDLLITQIIVTGWSRVRDVMIEHKHLVRIRTVDKLVVGIGYKRIDIHQLVHTRATGRRKVLVKNGVWRCIGDVALDNTDIPNDRAVCCRRSGIYRGRAFRVARKHRIVIR